MFDDADMAAVHQAGLRRWITGYGSDETVHIAAANPGSGYAQVFTQRTDEPCGSKSIRTGFCWHDA